MDVAHTGETYENGDHAMSYPAVFTGPGERVRLLALGDVDQRERDAVEQAKANRAAKEVAR